MPTRPSPMRWSAVIVTRRRRARSLSHSEVISSGSIAPDRSLITRRTMLWERTQPLPSARHVQVPAEAEVDRLPPAVPRRRSSAMISLGLWQLRRLDEKQTFNSRVTEHTNADVVPLDSAAAGRPADELSYRRVSSHRHLPRRPAVRSGQRHPGRHHRPRRGERAAAGRRHAHHRQPRLRAHGHAGARSPVRRGAAARPAEGRPGRRHRPAVRRRHTAAHRDPPRRPRLRWSSSSTSRWRRCTSSCCESTPAEPSPVQPVAFPELSEGPHLSYTIQWAIFSISVAVGWVFAVRKSIRSRPAQRKPKKRRGPAADRRRVPLAQLAVKPSSSAMRRNCSTTLGAT